MTRSTFVVFLPLALACSSDTTPAATPLPARCGEQAGTVAVGKLTDPALKEASGLASSIDQADLLWSHNDSGDEARLFALSKSGKARGQLHLDGVTAIDLEDLALGRDAAGTSYLYVGDIGDNLRARSTVGIYRVREPVLSATSTDIHATPEVMTFTYADGVAHDAETLLLDPRSSELYVVTKDKSAGKLFRVGPFVAGTVVAKEVGTVAVDTATGGSFAPDGSSVIVRDYSGTAKRWPIGKTQSLADAVKDSPCDVSVGLELQGEAICFDTDSKRIFTTSEGAFSALHLTEPAP